MGLFDRFKKKEEPAKKQEEKKDMLESGFPYFGALPDGTQYTLMDFEVKQRFRHRDGTVTVAVMAKIVKGGIDDTIRPNEAKFISFEIDPNQPVTKEICQKLIERYPESEGRKYGEYQTFLGKLTEQADGSIAREDGSATVLRYMDDIAKELLKHRDDKILKSEKEMAEVFRSNNERQRKEFDERFRQAQDKKEQELQRRLSHPYFIRVHSMSDSENYDGVNLSTGDVMRLREVHKIGKSEGTYLYTAFRKDTPNPDDVEIFPKDGIAEGYPIAFEIDFRLEDIPEMRDFDVTRWILSLLGTNSKELDSQKLNYIGKISRDGLLTRNKESDSKIINDKLQELQDYFKQKLAERFEGR